MNENDIARLLRQNGFNAAAILKAAKSGDANALLGSLPKTDREKIEKVLNNPDMAKSVLESRDAKNIISHFGENKNG